MFFWNSCFLDELADVGNLISGSSAFSKASLNIWKLTVHVLLKPGLENFEHYFPSMWDEHNCVVIWAFFGIAFLWDGNEDWPFPVLWPLLSFPHLLAYWVQLLTASSFRIWNSTTGIPSPPPALFVVMLPKAHSMKLWARPCRDIQDRWVMVESPEKMWSTGEGNDKPLQ